MVCSKCGQSGHNKTTCDRRKKKLQESKVERKTTVRNLAMVNISNYVKQLIKDKMAFYQETKNVNIVKDSNFIYGPEQSCKSPTLIAHMFDKYTHNKLSCITVLSNYTEHLRQLKHNIINFIKKLVCITTLDIPNDIYEGKDNYMKIQKLDKDIEDYLNSIIITSSDSNFKEEVKKVSNDNPKLILTIAYNRHLKFLNSVICKKVQEEGFEYNMIVDEIQSNMNEKIVYSAEELKELGTFINERKRKKEYKVSRNKQIMILLDHCYKQHLFVSATPLSSEFIFKDYIASPDVKLLQIPNNYVSHDNFNYYTIDGSVEHKGKTKTFGQFEGCNEWYNYIIQNYNPRIKGPTSHIITVARVGNCREHVKSMISGKDINGDDYKYYNSRFNQLFKSRKTVIVLYDKMAGKREVWQNGEIINIPWKTQQDKLERKTLSYILHHFMVVESCRVLIFGYDMFKEGMSVFSKRWVDDDGTIVDGIGPSTQWMKAQDENTKSIESIHQMSGRLCQTTGRNDLVFACSVELKDRIKSYTPMLNHLHNYQKKTETDGFKNCSITYKLRSTIGKVSNELKLNGYNPRVFKTKSKEDFDMEVMLCSPEEVKDVKSADNLDSNENVVEKKDEINQESGILIPKPPTQKTQLIRHYNNIIDYIKGKGWVSRVILKNNNIIPNHSVFARLHDKIPLNRSFSGLVYRNTNGYEYKWIE